MKKVFSIISLLMLVAVLMSCSNDTKDTDYVISDYDNESLIEIDFVVSDSSKTNESGYIYIPESETIAGKFIVKDKKYTFENNNFVIIDVTSQTEENCSVSINMEYLDETGKLLKNETKTFDQFYNGYQNYFLFNPDIAFDKYSYTVSASLYDGECYSSLLTVDLNDVYEDQMFIMELLEQGDYNKYPSIVAQTKIHYSGEETVYFRSKCILVNEKDEITTIIDVHGAPPLHQEDYRTDVLYYQPSGKLVWPENLKGEFKAIYAIESIIPC